MKSVIYLLLLLILALNADALTVNQKTFILVENSTSKTQIIIPANATVNEQKAAVILQSYIHKICLANLPIVAEKLPNINTDIYLGRTRIAESYEPSKIKNDGFFIATNNNSLIICGGSGKGVIYGVYHFIENYLGCKKYANIPATIKTAKQISLNTTTFDLQNPQFVFRQSYYPISADQEYMDWHKLQSFEDLWGLWGHSFFKIISPKKYFKTNPEYFSLVNEHRQATQLCLSNPDVYKLTLAYFKLAIADNPDAIYWSIAPNDDDNYCTCENCKKIDTEEGGPQGSLIRFVNSIAKQFPNKIFTTLAYGYTAKPSKTKPLKNVYPILSTIDAYRTQPLATEKSAAGFRKNLSGWSALTNHIFVWDYTTQFTNYVAPFPDYNNLKPNLNYFANTAIKGVFLQGSGDTYGDMSEFNSYLQAKLLWNPNANTDLIKQDFLNGYYGKAGIFINKYLSQLEENLSTTNSDLDIYGNPINNYINFLSPQFIDDYSEILAQAELAVDGQPELLKRVANVSLGLDFVVLQQSKFFGFEKFGYLIKDPNTCAVNVKSIWPLKVKKFVAQCHLAGVTELSEGGQTPDEYQTEWNEIFNKKFITNKAYNAEVKLKFPFSVEFPAKKERTLVDNVNGYKDFSYNWLHFYNKDLVATIELKENKTFDQIQTNFLLDPRHYIFLPEEVILETSNNGIDFEIVGKQTLNVTDEDYAVSIKNITFNIPSQSLRYIRLSAKCPKQLPQWRLKKFKMPAICCDEITVL
jgi:hypothetical protein